MFKKRYFSVHSDFKTGLFCKITIFLGILLLIISLFFIISGYIIGDGNSGILNQIYEFSNTTIPNSILAFSIIFFAIGVILYFFNCQFAKLSKIADEIEKLEEPNDTAEK
jgi:TRAP-type C4-dicarboxylate transport system permease small subunit